MMTSARKYDTDGISSTHRKSGRLLPGEMDGEISSDAKQIYVFTNYINNSIELLVV